MVSNAKIRPLKNKGPSSTYEANEKTKENDNSFFIKIVLNVLQVIGLIFCLFFFAKDEKIF